MVVLIWSDSEYGLITWHQLRRFGRPSHIEFNDPAFVKYAESFGAKGYRIERAGDLVPTLKDWPQHGRDYVLSSGLLGEHEADREAVEIKIAGVRIHSFQSFQQFQWFQTSEWRAVVFVADRSPVHVTVRRIFLLH